MAEYGEYNLLRATFVTYALDSYNQQTIPLLRLHAPSAVPEASTDSPLPAGKALTRRQLEIFQLIVRGKSNKDIARALNCAPGTVKVHVAALFRKLGVTRRAAVAMAGAQFLAAL
jgi:DNA-binding NarL/FixJ family response regulator